MVSRGRPKKEGSKKNFVTLRLNDEAYAKLKQMSEVTGLSKTDVLTDGINMKFNLFRHQLDE